MLEITEVQRQSRREMSIVHFLTKYGRRLNDKLDPEIREYLEWPIEKLGAVLRKRTRTPNLIFIFSVVFYILVELTRGKDGNNTAGRMISGQTRIPRRVLVRRTRRARVILGTVAFLVSSPLCVK